MIYFENDIVTKTLETIKDTYECMDILKDLNQIEQTIEKVKFYGDWFEAEKLDRKLRQKYPCIDVMINIANSMRIPLPRIKKNYSVSEAVISNLNQDYYGILCDTAIKKQLICNTNEFIKAVD